MNVLIIPDTVADSQLKESEKTLFGRILGECLESAEGVCTLSNAQLAERCGCSSVSTIGSGIKSLIDEGFIVSSIDRKGGNLRTLKPEPTLYQKIGIALLPLYQKFGIAPPTYPENLVDPISKKWYSPTPITKIWYRVGWAIASESQQFKQAIPEIWYRGDGRKTFSRARECSIESILINNILYNNSQVKLNTTPPTREESQIATVTITVNTPSGGLQIGPDDLAGVLEIRGADPARVGGFVSAHGGNHYNSIPELRNIVRAWLKATRPTPESKPAKLSFEERKEVFRGSIREYARNNPKRYPNEFYREFFDYWATPARKNAKFMVWEMLAGFDLPTRLSTSFRDIWTPKQQRKHNYGTRANTGKQTVTITADDLDGIDHSYPDDSFIDVAGIAGGDGLVTIEIGGF